MNLWQKKPALGGLISRIEVSAPPDSDRAILLLVDLHPGRLRDLIHQSLPIIDRLLWQPAQGDTLDSLDLGVGHYSLEAVSDLFVTRWAFGEGGVVQYGGSPFQYWI